MMRSKQGGKTKSFLFVAVKPRLKSLHTEIKSSSDAEGPRAQRLRKKNVGISCRCSSGSIDGSHKTFPLATSAEVSGHELFSGFCTSRLCESGLLTLWPWVVDWPKQALGLLPLSRSVACKLEATTAFMRGGKLLVATTLPSPVPQKKQNNLVNSLGLLASSRLHQRDQWPTTKVGKRQ